MLDTTFAALADPTRRSILEFLADGELSVGELVDEFSVSQSAVSRHLQVLEHAGLIARRRDGQRRLCQLTGQPLREALEWIDRYRIFWDDKLERLDRAVQRNLAGSRRDRGETEQ